MTHAITACTIGFRPYQPVNNISAEGRFISGAQVGACISSP
jgi:hypothetical protein